MNRRDFLKYSSLMIPATAAVGMVNPFTKNVFAAVKKNETFSLSVITDQPSRTIHTIEQAIKKSEFGSSSLQFTEYRLSGRHIGDIALVKSRRLINYHKGSDDFSLLLDESARSLSLPRTLDNPMLLRFSSQPENSVPGSVNIFRGETLIKQLSLNNDIDNYKIDGLKGNVNIRIKDKSVKVIEASCKHKTCMNMSAISRAGENLVCVPNQINISITGKNSFGVDSITF